MANQEGNMREHLRRRGVKPKAGGGEQDMESQPVGSPQPAPALNFGQLLFNSGIPHEEKLKIMQLFEGADPHQGDSVVNLHKGIYGSGLEGSLKDQLAQMLTYSPETNRNRNPMGRAQVPNPEGQSNSLDPRTGQAWDRGIGPSLRQRLLDQAASQGQGPDVTGGPAPAPPGGREGGSVPPPFSGGGSRPTGSVYMPPQGQPKNPMQSTGGQPTPFPGPRPGGVNSYGPVSSGGRPTPGPQGGPPSGPIMAGGQNPYGLPPQLIAFLQAFQQQGGQGSSGAY